VNRPERPAPSGAGRAPDHLPVTQVLDDLRHALDAHRNVVLVAPPGTGKTTGVPPLLLDEPWLDARRIVVLEPRRLAARAAASRMAALHGEAVGRRFGYTVRHDRRVQAATRVEVVTEGVLTRRLQADPSLEGIGLVVLDELHERSLEADLAMALLLDVQGGLRPDLRLLAMSATIDHDAVAAVMGGTDGPAPVLHARAPLHPVAVRWRPGDRHRDLDQRVAEVVQEALRDGTGDVLVFLPGRAEITRTARRLAPHLGSAVLLELHGSVPPAEQDRVLSRPPGAARRVILSTSIAETSVTVPGVRVVVDAGRRRTSAVDPRTGLPGLVTTAVSRAGADQRAGRAGREAPGICYRMWAETDDRHRAEHDPPEITRADLSSLVLQLAAWGVDQPDELRWMDAPPEHGVRRARRLLQDLDALDGTGRLTPEGRLLAAMPMAPRLGAMVLAGSGSDDLALEVAALIEAGGPGGVELAERVRSRRRGREPAEVDRVLAQFRRDLARRFATGAEPVPPTGSDDELDERVAAVALAGYADRVARRRAARRVGRRERAVFQLRHGGEVAVESGSPLAGHEWLVVVDLDAPWGSGHAGTVRLASGLPGGAARKLVEAHGREQPHVRWDPDAGPTATVLTRLDAITAATRVWRDPDPDALAAALEEALAEHGPAMLPRWPEADQLRARVAFAAAHDLACPAGRWPEWSDGSWESMREWLQPALLGVRDRAALARLDVRAVLEVALDHPSRRALDREAPRCWIAPDGGRYDLRYGAVDGDAGSVLMSVRLQRLLGVDVQPAVSSLDVPVTVELLSPADRPVQRTTDLPGFWRGSYAQVRAEMRSRYRRHEWPEHPV
jgi:ATP-dependent helicase HrpB